VCGVVHLIRKPAKLTGARARHELCTWGEPTRPGVGGLSRKHHTQCVEHNRTRHLRSKAVLSPDEIERLCAMAVKSANGRQKHHAHTSRR
jgi:hypothetical protein